MTARVLVLADRCDRCGSQAFVKVTFADGLSLLFCGHHYARHEAALVSHPWTLSIIDEREWINARPSPSV